jgi:hypothetical protein
MNKNQLILPVLLLAISSFVMSSQHAKSQYFNIPPLDLDDESGMQVVVDREEGEQPYILSVRFSLEELDKLVNE